MRKYFLVFKLAFLDLIQYRFDFIMHTTKYATMVMLMTLVWLAVANEGTLPFNRHETVSYFFIAAMIYSLSNFHTVYIEEDIKLGMLSKYLLKPISPFLYYIFFEAAPAVFETLLKVVIMVPLLFALGYGFELELSTGLVFLLFLPLIYIYSFHQFSLISGLSFWITEAWSIRWSATILFRFLSGLLVPVVFFPSVTQRVMYYLPFQHLAFTPIQVIQNQLSLTQSLQALGVLATWTVVLIGLRYWQWQRGFLQYESNGA